MKEVFIVFEHDEVDCTIIGVFEKQSDAEDFCAKLRRNFLGNDQLHFYFESHTVK